MLVTVKIEITREDEVKLTTEQQERIREQVQSEIENISLDDIVKYEGTEREEPISLVLEVQEVS